MFRVEVNQPANLLTITFTGIVEAHGLITLAESVGSHLKELNPGFRLLTDLSGLESMDPACAPYIGQTMDLLNGKGISDVLRVIPDPQKDIGFNLMSLFHYDPTVTTTTYDNREDAIRRFAL